jgi:two-component system sporulation sensor kinase C
MATKRRSSTLRPEEGIWESEERYRLLFETAQANILLLDQGRIIDANNAFISTFGYERTEIIGQLAIKFVAPESRELAERNISSGYEEPYEIECLRKDGTTFPGQIYGRQISLERRTLRVTVIRDITVRKRAEHALRESEENFRALADSASDGIIIPNSAGAFVYANRRAAEITGYSIEELLSMTMNDLTTSEEINKLLLNLKNRLRGKPAPNQYETLLKRKDGTIIPIEVAPSVISWKGQPASPAVFRDISKRKRAEELIKESESKYRTLVEQSLQGMLIAAGIFPRILYANSALANILGYTIEELLNLTPEGIRKLVHPEDQEMFFGRYQERLQGKTVPSRYEIRALRKDGSMRWMELLSSRITYEGKPAVQAVFLDRTERKLAEEALKESEAKYREIASSIPGIVYQSITHKDGTISLKFLSENVQEYFGISSDEIKTDISKIFSIVLPEDHDNLKYIIADMPGNMEDMETEIRTKSKTGEIKCLRIISKPHFLPDGSILRNGVAYDITEHKWVEEQVRRYSEELEERVRERTEQIRNLERRHADSEKLAATGRMAARIAHEINNPLAGIKNSFLLIKDSISPTHPYHKYVGIIEKEIDRIARIVRRTFDLYRPDREIPKEFSLRTAIGDIVTLLEPFANKNKIRFDVKIPETPAMVTLQEGYLTQVLFNIINNAIEASPKQGLIEITAKTINQQLIIEVIDQGKGIPEEIRTNIFEPFFTTKSHESSGGLGLGLSVSKSMVEAMGGIIDFESEVGKGTVFRVSIPLPEQTM